MGYANIELLQARCTQLQQQFSREVKKLEVADKLNRHLEMRIRNLDYTLKAMLATIPGFKFHGEMTNFQAILDEGSLDLKGEMNAENVFHITAKLTLPEGVTLTQNTNKNDDE